jgi:hypothetical protein
MSADGQIQLSGTVCEILAGPPATWRLQAEHKDAKTKHDAGAIKIEVEGGRRVRVETDGIEVRGDAEKTRGGWRELVDRAKPRFAAGELAPFTPAHLEVTTIAHGDEIAVWGDVITRDDAGRPERVRARAIARGPHAAKMIAHEADRAAAPERELGERVADGLLLAYTLACAAGAIAYPLLADGMLRDRLGVSIALVAAVILMLPSGPDESITFYSRADDLPGAAVPLTPVRMLAGFGALAAPIASADHPWAGLVTAAVLIVGGLVVAWLARGERARLSALLAPTWRGDATDARVTIRGTASTAHLQRVGGHDAVLGREAKIETTSSSRSAGPAASNRFHEIAKLLAPATFTITSDAGSVEVAPAELAWGTTCVEIADRVEGSSGSTYTARAWLPMGAAVVASGWISGGKLVARGTAPAILYATAPAGDPLAVPRGLVRYWRAVTFGLAVIGVALAVIALIAPR